MKLQLKKAKIKNFRSIGNLNIEFNKGELIIICGSNNIGKTNFLRALDLFFSLDKSKFNSDTDIPYHIAEGSRGRGYRTEVIIDFVDLDNNDQYSISTMYTRKKNEGNILELTGNKNNIRINEEECRKIVTKNKFILIESNNINLPKIISEVVKDEVLPELDRLRTRQSEPLKILEQFFNKSQDALSKIEKDITKHFKIFVDGIEGIESKDWEFKILFPEFDYLREAITNLVSFTLNDTNNRSLNTKGSGIQRMVLIALIAYISENYKGNVIWAIDEPEAFLQPSLQKRVFKELKKLAKKIDIFITTHSPHFVDITNIENTYLFEAEQEPVEYIRRPNEMFIKVNTFVNENKGTEKIESIRKHMGIERNDAWQVVPYNVLVEGEEDKEYLIALAKAHGVEIPNVLVAGGVDKMPGYIEFLKEFCQGLDFKPEVLCLLDHDSAGKTMYPKLLDKSKKTKELILLPEFIIRCDNRTEKNWDYEVEDYIYSDILFDAVNKILRKKGYSIITKANRSNRFTKSYESMNVLKYINQIIQLNNTDKQPLNFEDIGLKRYLCTEVCSILSKNGLALEENNNSQPQVLVFLKELFKG
jgi:predicted ATP-dependent endonuclease of OLD family